MPLASPPAFASRLLSRPWLPFSIATDMSIDLSALRRSVAARYRCDRRHSSESPAGFIVSRAITLVPQLGTCPW